MTIAAEGPADVAISSRVAGLGLVFLALSVGLGIAAAVGGFRFFDVGDPLVADINRRFAELGVKPSAVDFTYKKGLVLRSTIKAGDFATANQIINDIVSRSRIESWRYHPFESLITAAFATIEPALEPRLTEWIKSEPANHTPLLLRAQYYYTAGWAERGHEFAQKTDPVRMDAFVVTMAKALADITAAIRLDDRNPYNFYLKLRILQGNGF